MNLETLKSIYAENGCRKIYVKRLSPNDNSKNQVYLAGSFDILNIFPITKITTDTSGDWNKERFKAQINFAWIANDGGLYPAPKSQFILYPKYPEVRFSGFLIGCEDPPSDLMTVRLAQRLLFLGTARNGQVLGFVAHPNSEISNEFDNLSPDDEYGVFKVITLEEGVNSKVRLLSELKRVHESGWIKSKRLDRYGNLLPCESSNCGGYTLEAELGISANGYSEPDFLGWEIKQFAVSSFEKTQTAIITLMTPEPTTGFYVISGTEAFIRKYGYPDKSGKSGRTDRLNFGGVHKVGQRHPITNLSLELPGFDNDSGKIRNSDGRIALVDTKGNEAAGWSFGSLLLHWNRKHNQACYIPSIVEKETFRRYKYGNRVNLGIKTDFQLFLKQMFLGNIYYDPGIKMEDASGKRKIKKRSQFRIKSKHLPSLYKENEVVNVLG